MAYTLSKYGWWQKPVHKVCLGYSSYIRRILRWYSSLFFLQNTSMLFKIWKASWLYVGYSQNLFTKYNINVLIQILKVLFKTLNKLLIFVECSKVLLEKYVYAIQSFEYNGTSSMCLWYWNMFTKFWHPVQN